MNPARGLVILKVYLFHALGSLVTLLFCPQFGISLTGKSLLMPLLMDIHPALCFFGCGLLWMIVGQLLTFAFLSLDEHRVLGNTEWGLGLSVIAISLLFFGCLGQVQFDEWLISWLAGGGITLGLFNIKLTLNQRRRKLIAAQATKLPL
jgi:hypothetical protein